MSNLKYKTRGNSNPQGKPRVYFCCHKEDFEKFFESISDEVLSLQNCSVWYKDGSDYVNEELLDDLKGMQLFVMPVTTNLLCTENEALDIEFKFAIENHIPVLPLMQEQGLEQIFNQKCGELQFLDKHNTDITAISYEEKLKKYLESVLIGDEMAEKIRAAFDAYVFLSYRKKDRKYAQELMRLIHKNEFCRDIAIWYDEFLTPGENFNDSIKEALQKSGLFVLTVTPNLVNEINYIMTTEYPMAKQEGKPILPAELVPTDREELSQKYEDIPTIADAYNDSELSDALLESIKKMAIKENDKNPEHNFFIGLAYLGGVDVEVDHEKALSLITSAAEDGLIEANDKLYNMYLNGDGVERNFEIALIWFRKKIELLKKRVYIGNNPRDYKELISALKKTSNNPRDYKELISAFEKLLQHYRSDFEDKNQRKNICFDLIWVCEVGYKKFGTLYFQRMLGISYVNYAELLLDTNNLEQAEVKLNRACELLSDITSKQQNELYDNIKTATLDQLFDWFLSFMDVARLYDLMAQLYFKKNNYAEQEKYLLKSLEYTIEASSRIKDDLIVQINICNSYLNLMQCSIASNNHEKAIDYYEKGYELASELTNTGSLWAGEVWVKLNMLRAEIHYSQKEFADAIICYGKNILGLERSKLSPKMELLKFDNYYGLSRAYFENGEYEDAEKTCVGYLMLCKQKYGLQRYTDVYQANIEFLTDCKILSGNSDEAIKMHLDILDNSQKIYQKNNNYNIAITYALNMFNVGKTYLRCKKYHAAEKTFGATVKFAKFVNSSYDESKEKCFEIIIQSYMIVAQMFEQLKINKKAGKYFSLAKKYAKKSLKYHRTQSSYHTIGNVYGRTGDWYKNNGKNKKASRHYKEAIYQMEESVIVFREEDDKYFLASLYLAIIGTLPKTEQVKYVKRSHDLWKELLEKNPSSEAYNKGYNFSIKALKQLDA